jgi:hypothetical protein
MLDTPIGYFTKVTDLTTHQSGFMTASVRNGFRHIVFDPKNLTCNGAPYAFRAMYNTAAAPLANGQPTAWTTWSAHTDNVAYDVETGHFETPDAATDPTPRGPALLHRPGHSRMPGLRRGLRRLPLPRGLAERQCRLPDTQPPLITAQPEQGRLRDRNVPDRPVRDRPAADRGGQQRRRARMRPPHRGRAAPTRHRAPSTPGSTCCRCTTSRAGTARGRSPMTYPARSATSAASKPDGDRWS